MGIEPTILYEQDSTLLTTTIEVVLTVGATDDPVGKNGLTQFMGSLMLRGTKKEKRSEFQSTVEQMGGSLNVIATEDSLVFLGRVIRENTAPFLNKIRDFILTPRFDKKELSMLKNEILADIMDAKNSNMALAGLALRRTLFPHTVLEKPVAGGLSSVSSISFSDIESAYNNYVHRGNLLFAVASPLDPSEIKPALSGIWLKLPDGARHQPRSLEPDVPDSVKVVLVQKPPTSTGVMILAQKGIKAQDPDRYALALGDFVFGSEPLISRLFRIIRGELGWTYAIRSSYNTLGPLTYQKGIYSIAATPSIEFTGKSVFEILKMWREYLKKGVNQSDLQLAQDSAINSYPFDFETAELRLGRKLSSLRYQIPLYTQNEYKKKIRGISPSSILKALHQKHTSHGWVLILVGDAKQISAQLKAPGEKLAISETFQPDELIQ